MDEKTRAALEASIQHWRENVNAASPDGVSVHGKDCALCRVFLDSGNCAGCPVRRASGKKLCRGTPYVAAVSARAKWAAAFWRGDHAASLDARRKQWRAAAQAELDFLISLLPENAGKQIPEEQS